MKKYRIMFWTPGNAPVDSDVFGCASQGMFAEGKWIQQDTAAQVQWKTVEGEAFSGTYDQMLCDAGKTDITPTCILCFVTSSIGCDDFVDTMQKKFPNVPIMGGVATHNGNCPQAEVRPAGKDGAILLVSQLCVQTGCCRIHTTDVAQVTCEVEDKRNIVKMEGMAPADFLRPFRKEAGLAEDDFYAMTVHEPCGKNVFCSYQANGAILTGSDIQQQPLILATVPRSEATNRIRSYMCKPNTLAIGCAGLQSMLQEPIVGLADNVGVFLYGEIVPYSDGRSRFCNLMLGNLTA